LTLELPWETVLSHPLLLLIVGAGFSSFLIPWFTNRWQDHKKKLELTVSLAQRTSKLLSEMYTQAALAGPSKTQSDEEARKKLFSGWVLEGNMLRSELQAYFRNENLREYDSLAYAMMAWYHVHMNLYSQDTKVQDTLKKDIETLKKQLEDRKDFDSSKLSTDPNAEIWKALADHFRLRIPSFVEKLIDARFKGF
jgi:hypothetical protein